jgi:hypothetical protein
VGFLAGQILSALILFGVADGQRSPLGPVGLAARAVPPAWVVVGPGLVGLWIGFVGAVGVAERWRGTGSLVRDMGLRFRPWDP